MITHKKITIPTYKVGESEKLPMFFERRNYQGASGKVYPIPYSSKISDKKEDVDYDGYILENDYIKVVLLPEIGGKIHSITDKLNNYDAIYNNKVIKPAMVGLAGPWVSGGIEFNWPQHHRPTTFMTTDAKQVSNSVYMGEIDNFFGMHGSAGVSIEDGHTYVKVHAVVYNSTPFTRRFMWWANTAVEINENYAVDFPPDVNTVNDHDRRAILSWPLAKGVYKTARPWDYKDGTDIHMVKNIIAPTSLMIARDKCSYDFVCGYDHGKKAGVVAIGNRHVSPGKKLWIWGNSPFARKWCENLTDDGSQYLELMTGVYTDNQPDFTWIEPYELKEFDQYWYPIREIGEPKCATLDGALNMENLGKEIYIGIHMSGTYKNTKLTLCESGKVIYEETLDLCPESPWSAKIENKYNYENLSIVLKDSNGKELISFKVKQPYHEPIETRPIAPRPRDVATNEELYLHALHLYQYNHFAYRPIDYLEEALKRDPSDARCNELMGDLKLDSGLFDEAIKYYSLAIKKQLMRNTNPIDTSAYYKRGLANRYVGNIEQAYDDFYHAIWQYSSRSSAYYAIAAVESLNKNYDKAIENLNLCLETNAKNCLAIYMKSLLTNDESLMEMINTINPLFLKEGDLKHALLLARELINFGLYNQAISLISKCPQSPLSYYYLAYLYHLTNDEEKANEYKALGEKADNKWCFPNDLFDIQVLEYVNSPMTSYYLGLIYYHRDCYEIASHCFETTIKAIEYAPAYRNLALAYFDHLNKKEEAYKLMVHAFELDKDSRIFYELTQMQANMTRFSVQDKLDFINDNYDIAQTRDDVILKESIYELLLDNYQKSASLLSNHSFHTYEGGEGNLTSHHCYLYLMLGKEQFDKGNYEEALKYFNYGLFYPENYHETVTIHFDSSHLYYYIGKCYQAMNNPEYVKYFEMATKSIAFPNINFYFAALAYKELGNDSSMKNKLEILLQEGQKLIDNKDLDSYYGVGAPSRLPFAYDIDRVNTIKGLEYMLFAYKGLGCKEEYEKVKVELAKLDNASVALYLANKF